MADTTGIGVADPRIDLAEVRSALTANARAAQRLATTKRYRVAANVLLVLMGMLGVLGVVLLAGGGYEYIPTGFLFIGAFVLAVFAHAIWTRVDTLLVCEATTMAALAGLADMSDAKTE